MLLKGREIACWKNGAVKSVKERLRNGEYFILSYLFN